MKLPSYSLFLLASVVSALNDHEPSNLRARKLQCTGCFANSSGPCMAQDTSCHSLGPDGNCPPGTTLCEVDGGDDDGDDDSGDDDGDDDGGDDDSDDGADDDDVRPSPPSIGADVPVTYFGPAPSTVQRELIGPFQLLTSGVLDEDAGTITIPLYYGHIYENTDIAYPVDGQLIWYVLTDTTELGIAQGLGLNHSPKMRFANVGNGSRYSRMGPNNRLEFVESSLVDFSPERIVVPGESPNYFPPTDAQPGQVGLNGYSPLTYVSNMGETFNAPVVASPDATFDQLNAYCDGIPADKEVEARKIVHDRVVNICPRDMTVTLTLTPGHSFARPVLYLSTDAVDAGLAALEQATYAPGLLDVEVGDDDSFGSAVERLFAVTNGFTNGDVNPDSPIVNHPGRNGLNSALRGDGPPFNVLGGIPTIATDYSPLWDVNVGEWTQDAVDNGYRARWLEEFQILGFVERGLVTGPGGSSFGSSGNIVNCPIVHRFL